MRPAFNCLVAPIRSCCWGGALATWNQNQRHNFRAFTLVAPPLPHQTLSHVLSLTPGQVDAMANRVLDYFEEAHNTIDMTPEARSLFLAYQASWNVQAALKREREQGAGAAWHLGILAAASLVFEVATGDV